MANLTGMDYLPPHLVQGVSDMSDEQLAQEAAGVAALLGNGRAQRFAAPCGVSLRAATDTAS
ncbi:hypothetical protein ISX56_30285, partial [Serratia ureilytica]|nr:hypothetical protein [Serratia ureilytica]